MRAASGSPRRSAARRGRWARAGIRRPAARTTPPRPRTAAAASTPGTRGRASARRILRSRFDLPGIVEVDGAVEVHEEGFRAERARPYAFVRLPGRNPFLIDRLAAAYGAEVLDLRRPEELLAVCRERAARPPGAGRRGAARRRGDRRAPPRPRAPAAQRRPAGRRRAAGRRAGAGAALPGADSTGRAGGSRDARSAKSRRVAPCGSAARPLGSSHSSWRPRALRSRK